MPTKKLPLISGVLPTFNREKYLPTVLDAFHQQTLPADEFEVIIVDDGSTDETRSILSSYANKLDNIKVVSQNNSGISAAKNRGIVEATAPIILFLDDDDAADEKLFQSHVAAHMKYPDDNVAILGKTEFAALDVSTLMHFVTKVGCQLFAYTHLDPAQTYGHREFWGGRTSCKKALLRDMMFDPIFQFGCEDIELGWRLRSRGLKVRYCPQALTRMLRQLSLDEFCERSRKQGRAQAMFAQLHNQSSEVLAYCEISNAADRGGSLPKDRSDLYHRTKKLDAAVNLSKLYFGKIEREVEVALYACYGELFKLFRYSGILNEAKDLSGCVALARAS